MVNKRVVVSIIFILALSLIPINNAKADNGEPGLFALDEIVVTASKYPEKLSESPVSVEVVTQEDIQKKNAENVADLLRDVSGVNFVEYGGATGVKQLSIRGSDYDEVLVLIDGQPMNDPGNREINLGLLPVDQIKKIEIVKGPNSVLYGAGASGGVINITTKSGSDKPITNVDLAYGSFATRKINLSHKGSTGNLKYNISLLNKKTDGFRDPGNLNQDRIFTKFNYKLDNYSDLALSLRYNKFQGKTPGDTYGNYSSTESKDKTNNINLQWNRKTDVNDIRLTVYHNNHDYQILTSSYKTNNQRTGVEFVRTNYYQRHVLTYGLEAKENRYENKGVIKDDSQSNLNKAIFIEDEWQMLKKLKLNIGGRYDKHEEYGSEFSPRLGTVYNVNTNINLHASVGKAYSAPTFDQLYYYAPAFNYMGNPDLKPETTIGYETGVRYLDSDLKAEFNLFKRNIEDKIAYYYDVSSGYSTYENINSAEIKGLEIIVTKKLTDTLSTDFNYTYTDVRDEETGERLPYRPYHTANFGFTYEKQKNQVNLEGKLYGKREGSTYDVRDELPSAFVVDMKLSRNITKDSKVSLGVNNLFDRNYSLKDGYPMPGRNLMLEISRNF